MSLKKPASQSKYIFRRKLAKVSHKITKFLLICMLVCSSTAASEVMWNLVQTDSFGREFEISLVTSISSLTNTNLPSKHDIMELLSKQVVISFEKENPQDSQVALQARGGVVKIIVKTNASRKQSKLIAKVPNSVALSSGATIKLVPETVAVPVTSYPVSSEESTAAKVVSYVLRTITIVSGSLILINSFCNINGILLLKFIQMLDFINFFVLLNVNFREVVEQVFQALYNLSQNNFLLIPIPINFDSIPNQFEKYRGKLTELKVSPVLLQHQLPETVFFFILVLASILFKFFRFGGLSSRFSNFVNTMTFGYTQMILVEQLFYSLYQLTSSYNYKTYNTANIISYAGAMLSLVCISKMLAEIWTQVRQENFFAGTRINELSKPQFKVTQIDTLTHIKEFISADIKPQKLSLLRARLYNPLFMMRLVVMVVSTLALQGYPFYQLLVMAAYNLMLLVLTLQLALVSKIFESRWIAGQRILLEIFLNLVFILFIVCSLDQKMYFISLEGASTISLTVIIAIIMSITVEFFFFSIHFIRSIMLTYSNFKLYLFKINNKVTNVPKGPEKASPVMSAKFSNKAEGEKISPVLDSPGPHKHQSAKLLFAKRGSSTKESNTEASTFVATSKNSPKMPMRVLKIPVASSFATPIKLSQMEGSDPVPKLSFPKAVNNYVGNKQNREGSEPQTPSTSRLLMRHSERFAPVTAKNSPPQVIESVEARPFASPQKKPRTISVDNYNIIQIPNTVGAPGSAVRKDAILGIKSGKQLEQRSKLSQYFAKGKSYALQGRGFLSGGGLLVILAISTVSH